MKRIYWLTIALSWFFIGCNIKNEPELSAQSPVPDSAYFVLKQLQAQDSSLRSIQKFRDYIHADTILANSLTDLIEFLPTEEHRMLCEVFERQFEKGSANRGYSDLWKGEYEVRDARFIVAKEYFESALSKFKEHHDTASIGHTLNWLGAIHAYMGQFGESAKIHYQALELYEAANDSNGVISSMREIAGTFANLQMFNQAKSTFLYCLRYYERVNDPISVASVHSGLGDLFHQMRQPGLSEYHFGLALRIYERENYVAGVSEGYNNRAINYMTSGDFLSAKTWILRSKAYTDSVGFDTQTPTLLYNLAVCEDELGNDEQAITLFKQTLDENNRRNQRGEVVRRSLRRLSAIYASLGQFKEAYNVQTLYTQLNDSLYNENNRKATEELNIQYQTAKKEAQIHQALDDKKQSEFWIWTLSVSILVIVVILAGILSFLFYRNKRNKEIAEMESGLKQSELSRVKQELDFNKQQLSDYIETLKEKTSQILTLEEQIKQEIQGEPITEITNPQKTASNTHQAEEETLESIHGFRILTDEDWHRFKRYFDKVYPGMIQKLRDLQPEITAAEQRLFMLIRLNSESREIANMLGISLESVRKTKYRLKKKLNLSEDTVLDDYIKNFN